MGETLPQNRLLIDKQQLPPLPFELLISFHTKSSLSAKRIFPFAGLQIVAPMRRNDLGLRLKIGARHNVSDAKSGQRLHLFLRKT